MTIQKLNPYIIFNGKAADAIRLYESALGANVETITRYGDSPQTKAPPEHHALVLHATLRVGGGVVMLSDTRPDQPVATEGNVHIALHFTDPGEMPKGFDALAAGGKVTMPLQDTFWGAKFGMLTDAFGVRWMFNCELKKA